MLRENNIVRQVILASNRHSCEGAPGTDGLRHGRLCWEKKTMLKVSSFDIWMEKGDAVLKWRKNGMTYHLGW